MMIRLLWLLILLQGSPAIAAVWVGDSLIVSAPSGSMYLVGGNRGDAFITRAADEPVALPAYGVDANITPLGRDAIIVKNQHGDVIVTIPIPEKPPRVWVVILPIIAH